MRQAANLTAAPLHKLDGNHATNAHVSELNDLCSAFAAWGIFPDVPATTTDRVFDTREGGGER